MKNAFQRSCFNFLMMGDNTGFSRFFIPPNFVRPGCFSSENESGFSRFLNNLTVGKRLHEVEKTGILRIVERVRFFFRGIFNPFSL